MKFNWLISGDTNPAVKKACIDLEYHLRPKITKFLLSKLDSECCGDFSCFHFDVDMDNQWVSISEKTPKEYIDKLQAEFHQAINGSPFFSVA
ncbi:MULTISPECIES: hypothetical protein [Flavobacteriaceae]|uniref:hypothetical protein n=1 Tax=Flavobacteriaceae TaxID=49546 RepID=UPI001490A8D7|nr:MULTISPECIES: hypothetical protein [Allomuricauda]MDC6366707.1 hypothetical protein [Muricauda sp. AC10]